MTTAAALLFLIPAVLVAELGHRSYQRREAAARSLALLGPLASPALKAGQMSPDREIARRAQSLAREQRVRRAEWLSRTVRPTGWDVLPWADMSAPDMPVRPDTNYYLRMAHLTVPVDRGPRWRDYRFACQLWTRDLFLAGWQADDVRRLLDRMAEVERRWHVANPPSQFGDVLRPDS